MSKKLVLSVEGLSKQYRLGQIGTGTLSHDINRWWHRFRGKEDPYLKVGVENDRKAAGGEYVWSLRDVSFDVEEGQVLGIIGKNGAGKSTLLKILSQVTTPTTGEVKINGRIASLLEVGTGFHPELSGRENVFLNGAILGMTKQEILNKFDEIVEFSGVAKYIDTPVKRYSSGMLVRLGFAVAAHLEPEILIVDEVLAVGDQEFQDKCLGKMQSVSKSGRTVLFVSHNLTAVQQLCDSCLYLKHGMVSSLGKTDQIIEQYLFENKAIQLNGLIPDDFPRTYNNGQGFFRNVLLTDLDNHTVARLAFAQPFKIKLEFEAVSEIIGASINLNIATTLGQSVAFTMEKQKGEYLARNFKPGMHQVEVQVFTRFLPGRYSLTFGMNYHSNGVTIDWVENVYFFEVDKLGFNKGASYPFDDVHGYVEPDSNWSYSLK